MNVDDLTLEVRDKNLTRVGAITGTDLNGTFRPALNEAGEWELTLPLGHPMAAHLRRPGSGIILTLDGETVLSGPTTEPKTSWSANTLGGMCTFTGTTDTVHLADRRAYPNPGSGFASIQDRAEDRRQGTPADVMAGFVMANMGDKAPAERRIPTLTSSVTSSRDTAITKVGRFQRLNELLREIADPHSLAFDIVQLGAGLVFRVWDLRDRTRHIRLDVDNGQLASAETMKAPPEVTHVIVAGKGELSNRRILECTTPASLAAGAAWGRRIEDFMDDPATEDETELRQMGAEELAAGAPSGVISKAVPVEDSGLRYGTWRVGDLVSVTLNGEEDTSLVTGAVIIVGPGGVRIGAQIGEVRRFNRTKADQMARVEKGLSRISRAGSSGGGSGGGGGGGAKVEYATIAQDPFYTESGLVKIIPEGSKDISSTPVTFMRSYIPAAGDYVVILDGIILGRAISGPYDAGQWSEPIPPTGRLADADVSRWGELTVTKTSTGWVIVTGALTIDKDAEQAQKRIFTLPGEMRPTTPDAVILTAVPNFNPQNDRPINIRANGEVLYDTFFLAGSVLHLAFAFNNNPDGLDSTGNEGRGAWGVDAYGTAFGTGLSRNGAVAAGGVRFKTDPRYYVASNQYQVASAGSPVNNIGKWGYIANSIGVLNLYTKGGNFSVEQTRYDTAKAGLTYTIATPQLTNAWRLGNAPLTDKAINTDAPRYVLRPDGIGVLAGGVQGGILGKPAFTLPEGMRPKYETVYHWGRITPAGEVIPATVDAPFTHSMWIADH